MEAAESLDAVVNDNDAEVLFIPDIAAALRTSRSTVERRLKDNSFPIPELPRIDKRRRWSRRAVDAFLSSSSNAFGKAARRPLLHHRRPHSVGGR